MGKYRKSQLSPTCQKKMHDECPVLVEIGDMWTCSCKCHNRKRADEVLAVDAVDYFISAVNYVLDEPPTRDK